MPAPNWGVPVYTLAGPGGRVAYLAQYPGAPRFQIWVSGQLTCDKFAFSSSDRVSLNGAWGSDGTLMLMAGAAGRDWLGRPVLGAPRLQKYTDQGHLVFDGFVADSARRESWVPVPVDVVREVRVEVPVPIPMFPPILSAGSGFVVRLAFEGRRPEQYVRTVFNEAARLLTPLGIRVTTERPFGPVSEYGQVILDAPVTGGFWPGPRWDSPPATLWEARCAYISPIADPMFVGCGIAHEVGHAFGLQHRSDGSVMDGDAPRLPYRFHPDDENNLRDRVGEVS